MENKFTLKDGEFLIKTAREALKSHFSGIHVSSEKYDPKFDEKRGVFVTLLSYPKKELKGCIGYPTPVLPLMEAIKDAVVSAAVRDVRFKPMNIDELKSTVAEISVLTVPEEIKVGKERKEIIKQINVGKDGLIVDAGFASGLLLPQVAVEEEWNAEEFLSQTCYKAGLGFSDWLNQKLKVMKFQAQVFSEETPEGKVVEKKLEKH